jgi:hypothetical protein
MDSGRGRVKRRALAHKTSACSQPRWYIAFRPTSKPRHAERHAPVAQGIEHRPPEAGARVRISPGAPVFHLVTGSFSGLDPVPCGYACAARSLPSSISTSARQGDALRCSWQVAVPATG